MQEEIWQAAARSIISIIVLFGFTRLSGKKQISQLSFFHYVIGISIGSIAAAYAVDKELEFTGFLVSMIIYGVFPLILSQMNIKNYIVQKRAEHIKNYKFRKFLNGSPTILIQDGKIIENNLRKTKINVNELLEECRLKNAFNISEVEFAILETNGQVSVQPKSENLPVTIKDMAIDSEYKGLCANIIIDGNIIDETLQCLGKTKKWAENEIKKSGVTDISDILLAFMDSNGKISIYKKSDSPKVKTVI